MTQNSAILAHLATGATLTPLQALRLCGTLRLGARIYELRREHAIQSRLVRKDGKWVAMYWLDNLPCRAQTNIADRVSL